MDGVMSTTDRVVDVNGTRYWVGEGNAASGVLPVCPANGTVCLAWRSATVMSPNCWGTVGGAVQHGLTPAESARRELREEVGYEGEVSLDSAYVLTDGGFTYYNFIGAVPAEFSFCPSAKHGWENQYIAWRPYDKVLADIAKNPQQYHPGVQKLFAESAEQIRKTLQSGSSEGAERKKLFLDDVRQPPDSTWDVAHSFEEFVAYIQQKGIPDTISFDFDIIGDKTGLDCARYLIERGALPKSWSVHSANPLGRMALIKELSIAEKRRHVTPEQVEAWCENRCEELRQQAGNGPRALD
jgi:8-oxo-dGTP pyrophosphatase MutT (NUDIX family)